jgi:integrase
MVRISANLREIMTQWFADSTVGKYSFECQAKNGHPLPLTVNQAHDYFKRTLHGKWSHMRGWHVLRHSFASNCAAAGVDQRIINGWMGHQTEAMVRRYQHLIPDVQQRAMESVFQR